MATEKVNIPVKQSGQSLSAAEFNQLAPAINGSIDDAAAAKTVADAAQPKENGKGLSTNDYTTAEKSKLAGVATGATAYTDAMAVSANASAIAAKQNTLTFDSSPTSGSVNPVTSGGVFNALGNKQNTLTFDATPTNGSTNPVTSGGIFAAIGNKLDAFAGALVARVEATGNNTTGLAGREDKPFATIEAALNALTAVSATAPKIVKIGMGSFAAPTLSAVPENIWFQGVKKPFYNATISASATQGETTWSNSPTALINGTIITGMFNLQLRDNIVVTDLGVDVGKAWCDANNGGVASEGMIFGQYNTVLNGGTVTSPNNIHKSQTDSRPRNGVVVRNVIILGYSPTSAIHCFLAENLFNPLIENVTTCYGIHGLAVKTFAGIIRGVTGYSHGTNALIIKANFYAYNINTQVSDVYCGSIVAGEGAGIRLSSPNTGPDAGFILQNLILTNFQCFQVKNALFTEGSGMNSITIANGIIDKPSGTGVTLSGIDNLNLSSVIVRNGTGIGFDINANGVVDRLNATLNTGIGIVINAPSLIWYTNTSATGNNANGSQMTLGANSRGAGYFFLSPAAQYTGTLNGMVTRVDGGVLIPSRATQITSNVTSGLIQNFNNRLQFYDGTASRNLAFTTEIPGTRYTVAGTGTTTLTIAHGFSGVTAANIAIAQAKTGNPLLVQSTSLTSTTLIINVTTASTSGTNYDFDVYIK
jgi:hypothetical protein